MPRVVIAGPPGAGKTTLLAELARRGHATVSDSAREVIAERRSAGLPPRPDPVTFAEEIYRRDLAKYHARSDPAGLVFFERTAIESRAMLEGALRDAQRPGELDVIEFDFVQPAFVLPPWRDIYRTDEERDHTFEHALRVHEQVVRCYGAQGYRLCEVPRQRPQARADFVLAVLAGDAA